MELILTHQTETDINVTCDGQYSHGFDLKTLISSKEKELSQPLDDPMAYGEAVYLALFPPGTLARHVLETMPERILLVTIDNDLDAIPWEYVYGPDGFLVLEYHFVRGLPADKRISSPTLESGLHIIAVPSNPLSQAIEPLNIDGEWMRLKDIVRQVPYAITLERTRPPTIEQVRTLVANQNHRVIHFMGHGGQNEQGAFLCFEQENGELDPVTARQFALCVRGTVFLVTLNACVTATPGATSFSNLAASLIRQKTPYALGMRYSIPDEDARVFSRVFYSDLARGSSVEEALLQARLTLANSPHAWAMGVPVLYTSLAQPAAGFPSQAGTPLIKDHQPYMEVSVLSRAEGAFQGRFDELKALGTALTGDSRLPLVTIHGAGGLGKTALAREAVERFAFAWPGGVYAIMLENLPSREVFVADIASFLGIDTKDGPDPLEVERLVLTRLSLDRTLIVLDNAETLVQAVDMDNQEAVRLAQFIREQIPRLSVGLIATSRTILGWSNEIGLELVGLDPLEGVRLFTQNSPQRTKEIGEDRVLAWKLSEKVEGHPLSLRLLSGAFNVTAISLQTFIEEYEIQLLNAENKYAALDHRHRTLFASIETSARYLNATLSQLFSRLWIFNAAFLPEIADDIFDPEQKNIGSKRSPISDSLFALWRRGLLVRETSTLREGTVQYYRLLPNVRSYIEGYLKQDDEREQLLERFGIAYANFVRFLHNELDRNSMASFMVLQCREDLERAASYLTGLIQGYYLLDWAWVLQRLGDKKRGLQLTEQALEIGQGQDEQLVWHALNNMALIYQQIGQRQQALALNQQALVLVRTIGDQTEEARTLNNIATVYQSIGQPKQALEFYEQSLQLTRTVGDQFVDARTLHNMADVHRNIGLPTKALELYEQALPLMQKEKDLAGEAQVLKGMALVFESMGQLQQALSLNMQALPIKREVGDNEGVGSILSNMAWIYYRLGQSQQALTLFAQALLIRREEGDKEGEATTLNNMAVVLQAIGQIHQAAALFAEALPIKREVGDKPGEAAILNNIAGIYQLLGEKQKALTLYKKVLTMVREMNDQAGEAATLNGLAYLLMSMQYYAEALETFEQSITLARDIINPASEAAGHVGKAFLQYQHFRRPHEAIIAMEHAIATLEQASLSQDAGGNSIETLQKLLANMRQGISLSCLSFVQNNGNGGGSEQLTQRHKHELGERRGRGEGDAE
jgi:tetratricopeptide (TPR) repeat protein